ncbi:uncharacterized protein B0T15DRAFT_567852 [Chaetomium strumarium]|uniref:Uncharacterized protein n=1 Tax=Chaetomium strumarium TaxID=1170767 RepID=A0AAJ0GU02_9PEZI|nr:hypothetical protein B0T15DRAFT_567852 [Chaetomium strumarium]
MEPDRKIEDFKRQSVECLDGVYEEIESFADDVYILSDEHLQALNIRNLAPLDVEEHSVDFGPRFFYPRFTLEQAQQKTVEFVAERGASGGLPAWPKRCRRGSSLTLDRHPLCCPMTHAAFRLEWFLEMTGMGCCHPDEVTCPAVWHGLGWDCLHTCNLVPPGCNHPIRNPRGTLVGDPPRPYSFHVSMVFLIQDPSADKPHIGATVLDSTESGEQDALRSEVAAAIWLLKQQFRRGDFRQHHTLPALVFSFQHDQFGRITQFHFNGQSLMLRQSRLLNFRSDEPTTDAYHMLRWIANQPMGETRFLKPGANMVKEPEVDTDKPDGRLPANVPSSDIQCPGV